MLWLALLLPDLPLQVYARSGIDAPLAVVAGHPRPRVIAASPQARALGVEPGQGVATAQAVAPALQLRARTPALEAETLAEVACWAGAYSPRISLVPPDAVLLEIESSLKLFGGALAIADAVHQGLARLGLQASLATAPTPLAARWFARTRLALSDASLRDWRGSLDSLPLTVLADGTSVTPATLELLAGVGLRTLGETALLPRAALARRQATAVTDALARARGDIPDPQPWFQPPVQYAHRLALPAPVSETEALAFAARRLFAGLAAWLASRHAAVDQCVLELIHERHPATRVPIVSGAPCRDDSRLALLAREHLARLKLLAPVEELRLLADAPQAFTPQADDLFGRPGQARDNAMLLLDRLRARLGADAIHLLDTRADHRPEVAWTGKTATSPSPLPSHFPRCPATAATKQAPPKRPLWLLPEPRPLAPGSATLLEGPERIEGGWWDQIDIRRDYYLARGPDDALWWIFEDLDRPGAWYVHGYFG
ncbi:MAG: DNA polymerase Y family protein [Proteobacteria bacterium]|nr:DNA polymerase Y family protein [Pseudomonadota bacterium]